MNAVGLLTYCLTTGELLILNISEEGDFVEETVAPVWSSGMPGWKPRLFFFRHWHWCHRIPVHQGHHRASTLFPHTCYLNVWLCRVRYIHSSHTRRSAGLVTEPRSLAWKSNDLPRDHRETSNSRLCVGELKIQSYMFTWFCRNMVYIPMHYIRLWQVSLLLSLAVCWHCVGVIHYTRTTIYQWQNMLSFGNKLIYYMMMQQFNV